MDPLDILVGLLGWGIGPSQGLNLHTTAQHRKTRIYIHASSGIRTHNSSAQAFQDHTRLRSSGNWD